MFRFSFLASVLFLSGCLHSWSLPLKNLDLESQIPPYDSEDSRAFSVPLGGDFASTFFPDTCDWVPLKRVVDGDTIIVYSNTRVRMLGIDAPESAIPDTPPEPFGKESSRILTDVMRNQDRVCLIADPIGDKRDKYDRELAYVFLEDGLDVNAWLIETGAVEGYFRFPLTRTDEFRDLHNQARREKLGLWAD